MELKIEELEKLYGTDSDTVEIVVGTNKKGEDIIFGIGDAAAQRHERTMRKYAKKLERFRRMPEKLKEINIQIAARSLFLSFRGLDIPDTVENREQILRQFKRLYIRVMEEATNQDNFMATDDIDGLDDDEGLDDMEGTPEEDTEKN